MSNRQRENLAARREQTTITTAFGPSAYKISIGAYPDGRPAEVFISTDKASTDLEAIARDAAIMISIALQYGAKLEDLRSAATRDAQGFASSIIGHTLDLVAAECEGRT